MYQSAYFKEEDRQVLLDFMRQHSFVVLTGCDEAGRPVAAQIPLLVEEKEGKLFLYGHIQRKTDHHLCFVHNPQVLAIFNGPHAYISARWYTNQQNVSTWNYMTVHARGTLRFVDDAGLLDIVTRTTAHYEQDAASPSLVEKMPEEYVTRLMKAIIGFEIEVTQLDHVFKLSQNRDKISYQQIIPRLREQGGDAALMADEMEKRIGKLF
ncbi:MAG TPA: FMN-binding negative transcriptional regulator [Chitinophagaceae bacterium]|nr:FMN-binding negative transcriptional regulator [Chitinophagaceae bacterium]